MLPWIENLDEDVKTVIKGFLELCEREEDPAKSGEEFIERILAYGGFRGVEFNIIPSAKKGKCQKILVVVCLDRDNIKGRFRDAKKHIRRCTKTKHVIYVTSRRWITEWKNDYEPDFKDLVDSFIVLERIGEGGLTKAI